MSMAMAAFVPNVPNPKPVTGQRKSQSNSQWHLAFLAQLGFLQLFLVVSSVLNVRFNSPGDPHDDGLIQSLSYLSEDVGASIASALWHYTILKRDQCRFALATMGDAGFVRFRNSRPVQQSQENARRALHTALSHLNYDHGTKIPWEIFYNRMVEIHNVSPEEVRAGNAGMIDSDGGLYVQQQQYTNFHICVYQSCYPYVKALSVFLLRAYGIRSRIYRVEASGNSRERFILRVTRDADVAKMICTIGVYGLSRRIQWLVLLIVSLAKKADRGDVRVITAFARVFLKFVR